MLKTVVLLSVTIYVIPNFCLFTLFLTISEISANLGFLKFSKILKFLKGSKKLRCDRGQCMRSQIFTHSALSLTVSETSAAKYSNFSKILSVSLYLLWFLSFDFFYNGHHSVSFDPISAKM